MLSGPVVELGILLPHFGDECTRDRLIGHARRLEEAGYDSVWVRDNLAYAPHPFEPPGRRFVDGFVALAGIATTTRKLGLGTAVTIPFRSPAVTTQLVGSLCWLAPSRVSLGVGFGSPRAAFRAVGVPFQERFAGCEAMVAAIRGRGQNQPSDGGLAIDPAPPEELPIWFGGASERALQFACRWCDGVLLARASLDRIAEVRERLATLCPGRSLRLATQLLVLPGNTRREALAGIDVDRLLAEVATVNKRAFASLEEAVGAVAVGPLDHCVEHVRGLMDVGVDLIIIDLRLVASRYEPLSVAIAEAVLPVLRSPLPPTATR